MFAEIITIGDEILIGQVIDTNSAWIGQQLNDIGIRISHITSISDTKEAICEALDIAKKRADVVFITGGLGPTKDDITKITLAEYFDKNLVFHDSVMQNVKSLFAARNITMPEVNKNQAMLPEGIKVLFNENGTAPGMWFEEKGMPIVVSMPGVPFEMKSLMLNHVLPLLCEKFDTPTVLHETILTMGIGESSLMEIIDDWEESLEKDQLKLAYLPSSGSVRLRISGVDRDEDRLREKLERKKKELIKLIPEWVYGFETQKIEEIIGQLLEENDRTLSSAESCTGGFIAHLVTSIPGCSTYYQGSVISYSNDVKINQLGVEKDVLLQHGAVSEEVVRQMAEGVRRMLRTDYAVATSGIAGPDGGSLEKPVGTVWIAVAGPNRTISKLHHFGNHRENNIRRASLTVLNDLRKEILRDT